MDSWILTCVIFTPLLGAVVLMLARRASDAAIRDGALYFSLVTLALTALAVFQFHRLTSPDVGLSGFVLTAHMPWIAGGEQESAAIDISYRVGVDGISIWLLALTALLSPLAIWSSLTAVRTRTREY